MRIDEAVLENIRWHYRILGRGASLSLINCQATWNKIAKHLTGRTGRNGFLIEPQELPSVYFKLNGYS